MPNKNTKGMPEYGQDTKHLSNSKLSTKQYKEDWGTNGE